MAKHHNYGGSKMGRRLACPGSAVREPAATPPDPEDWTDDGTLLHETSERILNGETDLPDEAFGADPVLGRRIVGEFVDYVEGIRDLSPSAEGVEQYIPPKAIGIDEMGGALDYVARYELGGRTIIECVDLKAGIGDKVEPHNNPQGLTYLCIARAIYGEADEYRFKVIQPQRGDSPAFACLGVVLDEFENSVREAQKKPDEFNVGDHCRMCNAHETCEAVHGASVEVHEIAVQMAGEGPYGGYETAEEYDEALAHCHRVGPAVRKFMKALNGKILDRIREGGDFPELQVVERLGNKTWIHDEETTLKKLRGRRINKRDATEAKLLSAPKLFEKYGDKVADLFHRPPTGYSLVKANADRESVDFSPESQFDEIIDEPKFQLPDCV